MAKDRDNELNQDLPGGDEFSLESILAEFGGGRKQKKAEEDTIPFPVVPKSQRSASPAKQPGRVLTFPDGGQDQAQKKPSRPAVTRQPPVEKEPAPRQAPPPADNVLDFPEEAAGAEESPLAQGINRLLKKADDYAQHMFEEEGVEDDTAVRRAEEFIPGTDEEEAPSPRRRERKPRKEPPPAPDLPPADLARRYGKGLKGMRVRSTLVFLLFLPALYLTLEVFPHPQALTPQLRVLALAGVQVLAMLLGLDVLFRGLFGLLRLEFGMDTLLLFSCAATLADALTMYQLDSREGQMPYCAAIVLGISLLLRGTYRKRRGLRLACKTAASASHPYLVTLDEGKWNGRDTYAKWSGEAAGFGRQMQASDGAQRIFRRICPLLFIAALLLSIVASIGRGAPERLLWCLSATLTAATSLSGALCFGQPWLALCQRLSKSGAAIAGWDGVTAWSPTPTSSPRAASPSTASKFLGIFRRKRWWPTPPPSSGSRAAAWTSPSTICSGPRGPSTAGCPTSSAMRAACPASSAMSRCWWAPPTLCA